MGGVARVWCTGELEGAMCAVLAHMAPLDERHAHRGPAHAAAGDGRLQLFGDQMEIGALPGLLKLRAHPHGLVLLPLALQGVHQPEE